MSLGSRVLNTWFLPMEELLQYLFSGVTNGAIYAIIALGFTMLYNAT